MPSRATRVVRDYAQRSNVAPALTKPDTPALRITQPFSLGGILSPLLANIALSVLDEFIAAGDGGPGSTHAERARRRRRELPNYRAIRYADDFLVLVSGNRDHAEDLCQQVAAVLAPIGLRLSAEKTLITHVDDGFDFLGWHVQRHTKRGTDRRYVYTYPAKKSLTSITGKVKALCRSDTNLTLGVLLHQLNQVLRGWTTYFRPGVSFATFQYLRAFTWKRVIAWLRRKHRNRINWKDLRRRYCNGGWWPLDGKVVRPVQSDRSGHYPLQVSGSSHSHAVEPNMSRPSTRTHRDLWRAGCGESRTSGSGGGPEKRTGRKTGTALRAHLTWSRYETARWLTGRCTRRSGSPCPATRTFWACGRARAARAPSFGWPCSPIYVTGVSATCFSWCATASKASPRSWGTCGR